MLQTNQPSQAATLAAQMMSLDRPARLGPRPISDPPAFNEKHHAAWGASGWDWGNGGVPGTTGNLFIGKKRAAETGGWVYGLENAAPPQKQNSVFAALRSKILAQTRHPEPLNQAALIARFLGGSVNV